MSDPGDGEWGEFDDDEWGDKPEAISEKCEHCGKTRHFTDDLIECKNIQLAALRSQLAAKDQALREAEELLARAERYIWNTASIPVNVTLYREIKAALQAKGDIGGQNATSAES